MLYNQMEYDRPWGLLQLSTSCSDIHSGIMSEQRESLSLLASLHSRGLWWLLNHSMDHIPKCKYPSDFCMFCI